MDTELSNVKHLNKQVPNVELSVKRKEVLLTFSAIFHTPLMGKISLLVYATRRMMHGVQEKLTKMMRALIG